jgi:hypothetical protein
MRDAATVLEIIRERGRKGLPLERVYRCLFNPDLFLLAYGKLYRNAGAMTRGITRETVDGMSLDKIETIITVLRQERYRWTPVRRTYIDKKGTRKKRPLGLPTWSDKLVQEVIRQVLEAYYEPQFSDRSHGFRPGRGCHTALGEIYHQWHGTVWFIEGDISDCFGSLDHSIMVSILAEKIHDGRFLRLISGLLGPDIWRTGDTIAPSAVRRKAAWSHPSSRISTWTGWTPTSNRLCSRPITRETDAHHFVRTCGYGAGRGSGNGVGTGQVVFSCAGR